MKTSQRGIELIKQFEGLELEAYQDIAGIWTIGYGHTGPDVEPGMRISEKDAEALLKQDLKSRESAVSSLTSVDLNQNEFDALVSFVYNVGAEAYRGSTARKRLNRGDRLGAAEALTWWNKATVGGVLREVEGLTRRRAAERALFLTPVNPPIINADTPLQENSRATPIEDSPRRDTISGSRTVQGATVAGGAGVAATTMGHDSAEELNQIETNIEDGTSLIEDPEAGEGSTPPSRLVDDADADDAGSDDAGSGVTGDDVNDGDAPADVPADVDAVSDDAPTNDAPTEAADDGAEAPADGADGEAADTSAAGDDGAAGPDSADAPADGAVNAGDAPADPGATDAGAGSDGAADSGVADGASTETAASDSASEGVAAADGAGEDGVAAGDGESVSTSETISVDPSMQRPSKHEVHAVEAQVQFALLVLILLAVAYIIFARIDDWLNYRR